MNVIQAGRPISDYPIRSPWGACVHTTGGGITDVARERGVSPADVAKQIYRGMLDGSEGYRFGGPAYFVDLLGDVYQMCPEDLRSQHIGSIVDGHDRRQQYLSGEWLRLCSPAAVAQWRAAWPDRASPQALFPTVRPNEAYIGIELIPVEVRGGGWRDRGPGSDFTEPQYHSLVELLTDIARRQRFPTKWWRGGRLVGHEDVGLIDRSDTGGGWDPGARRQIPRFDWSWVRNALDQQSSYNQ